MNRVFREYVYVDNLGDSAHALVDSGGLVENSHHHVDAYGDPDLGFHSVLAQPVKGLDPQILLDPLEEELDLPASLVDLRHNSGVDLEVVRHEDQPLPSFRIQKAYPVQVVGIEPLGLGAVEANRLVGPQAGGLVHRARLANVEAHVALRSDDEERMSRVDARQPGEIDVSAVHYIEGTRFEDDPVQGIDLVDLPLGDRHERRDLV